LRYFLRYPAVTIIDTRTQPQQHRVSR
jgi:hypothetical protein